MVNCALLNEKTWDFLLNHYNSPLSATGNTIYFQNFESIPPQWSSELLAAIEETGLARRVRSSSPAPSSRGAGAGGAAAFQ